MSISIQPATLEDASEMLDVGMAAFANDLLNQSLFQLESATPEERAEFLRWRLESSKVRMRGPGKHWFKATDESTGKIVGLSGLYSPEATDTSEHSSGPKPRWVNQDLDNEVNETLEAMRQECMGDRKDFWYVRSMAVLPDYQGKGIARKLLERGVQGADEAGQDVYLEGTAAGQRLYRRCGFEDLKDISLLNGAHPMKAMLRRPRDTSAQKQ